MEGIIPMVYRAIKRNRVRRQYKCLSSGAALSYNIADFYVSGGQRDDVFMTPQTEKIAGINGHRRHKSVGDYSLAYSSSSSSQDTIRRGSAAAPPAKKLVRFRSHRMFSCVTGV